VFFTGSFSTHVFPVSNATVFLSNLAYLNLHTSKYLAGEIRGQLTQGAWRAEFACVFLLSLTLASTALCGTRCDGSRSG